MRNHHQYANHYSIISFLVLDGFILGWLIYGNILFFSKDNNCNKVEDSKMLYSMMLILLIFGYFQMAVYLLIIILLPIIIYQQRHQNRGPNDISEQAIPEVLKSLTKLKFNQDQFTKENQCSICFLEYNADDDVTQLICDPKHYFHSDCIEDWIKHGKNSCPLCRQPIKQL